MRIWACFAPLLSFVGVVCWVCCEGGRRRARAGTQNKSKTNTQTYKHKHNYKHNHKHTNGQAHLWEEALGVGGARDRVPRRLGKREQLRFVVARAPPDDEHRPRARREPPRDRLGGGRDGAPAARAAEPGERALEGVERRAARAERGVRQQRDVAADLEQRRLAVAQDLSLSYGHKAQTARRPAR